MSGRLDMCFPVWRVRLSYRLAQVYPAVSPRSRTRCGTRCCRSCCEVASPAGPPPTTTTSIRSGTSRRQVLPDPFGDAVRESHDGQVGVDLERVGKEARVRHSEPREAVHPPPGVGDRVGGAPSHPAPAHEMRRRDGQHAGPEMTGGDALLEPVGVGGLEERRIRGRMHALCAAPKPVRLFAVTNGKYMQVSSTKRSDAAWSTK